MTTREMELTLLLALFDMIEKDASDIAVETLLDMIGEVENLLV